MQVSVVHKPDTYFRFFVRPSLEKKLVVDDQEIYYEVEDYSIQPKIIHVVNINKEEIEAKMLFDIQCEPKGIVDRVFEEDQNLKYKIVEVHRLLMEINKYPPGYEMKSGKISAEFCYQDMKLNELEIVARNLIHLANAVEK
ncbi:MAG: hypothetical protein GY796_32005 [Chloroflexi bacterium]|nr:hypothetical protein [Chloroflexota bacterium]